MPANPPLPTHSATGRPDPITLTAALLGVASLVMAYLLRHPEQAPRMTAGVMVSFCLAPLTLAVARSARPRAVRTAWGWAGVGSGLLVAADGVWAAHKNDSLQLLRYDFPTSQVVTLAAVNLAPVALAAVGIALVLGGAAYLSGDRVVATLATAYTALAALVFAAALAAVSARSLPYIGGSIEPKFAAAGALVAFAALLFPVVAIRQVAGNTVIEDARGGRRRPTRLFVVVAGLVLITVAGFWGYGRFADRQTVADLFADPALADCVATGLHLDSAGDATSQNKLDSVFTLDCNGGQAGSGPVRALDGLARLTHLSSLDLAGNQIGDLRPLSQVPTLTSLKLGHNQISDVSPLGALTQLQDLGLSDNRIQDLDNLGNLGNLTQLRTLGLSGNRVVETGPLGYLAALTELDLSRNRLTGVHALDGLTADATLTELDLSDNGLTDVHALTGLAALSRLTLKDNRIRDLSPLAGLPALTMLNVTGNQVRTAAALARMPKVDELWLGDNPITDLGPLRRMPSLQGVDLEGNDPARMQGLQKLRDQGVYVGGLA